MPANRDGSMKMEKISYPCPCGGQVKWKKERVIQEEVDCGVLDVEVCDNCGEVYLPEESMLIVEENLKQAGLWGVERKEVKFWKSGSSVTVRLPTEIARKLGLLAVKKGYIYQEGKNKLAIEF